MIQKEIRICVFADYASDADQNNGVFGEMKIF